MPRKTQNREARRLAGEVAMAAVLANVLVDKGVVGRDELLERFEQAHGTALRSTATPEAARLLAAMVSYLTKLASRSRSH
jgi:hypothetical protein